MVADVDMLVVALEVTVLLGVEETLEVAVDTTEVVAVED